mmetsp:Transcript_49556/g.95686  ORF Transcript_49556/g.95686 Transcript_49556/m.95686 type:complete len:84 (+) Transcript_49556:296-547(+)
MLVKTRSLPVKSGWEESTNLDATPLLSFSLLLLLVLWFDRRGLSAKGGWEERTGLEVTPVNVRVHFKGFSINRALWYFPVVAE